MSAARVREALRALRSAYRADDVVPMAQRQAVGTLVAAVDALVVEHEQLLQRSAVVRAHIELALEATVAGRARVHEQYAVSMLDSLGVVPSAADYATATVAVAP